MKPIAGVWRKGNRRARRGERRSSGQAYWPLCPAPAMEALEPTVEGFSWACRGCGFVLSSAVWIRAHRLVGHKHHIPKESSGMG